MEKTYAVYLSENPLKLNDFPALEKTYAVYLSENPLKLNDFPISLYANIFSRYWSLLNRGRDRMVVGFISNYAIGAYHP